MAEKNEIPSLDPADSDSMPGMMRMIFRKLMMNVDGMLPAEVVSYDRNSNTATVRPLIQVMGTSGESTSRQPIAKVPVLAIGGGGFVVNFPLKAGDRGWIEASDRDISKFMQSLGETTPNTLRLHSFEDGRFIPDIFSQFTISDEDEGDMVIQSLGGSTKIVVADDAIRLKSKNILIEAEEELSFKSPTIKTVYNESFPTDTNLVTRNRTDTT